MFGMSIGEMLFIGILGLIVIGPKQLPEVARTLGRFLNELRRASGGLWDDLASEAKTNMMKPPLPPANPPQAQKQQVQKISNEPTQLELTAEEPKDPQS